MSGKRGVADTSRGPLLRPGVETNPGFGVRMWRALREDGWSYQRIADQFGVPYRRVYKALNREQVRDWDRESERKNRAWHTSRTLARRRANAPLCDRCGEPLSRPGNQPPCRQCRIEIYAEKLELLAKLWTDGMASREIARILDVPPRSVGTMVTEARRRGLNLPARPPGYQPSSVILKA